ncbi:MAG: hypothetical protein CM15mV41_0940 [Caudoviricetes sp.]|nr:MAG: hypothetical protein CM15mV41_0940 [Caudoviricetes sp.]
MLSLHREYHQLPPVLSLQGYEVEHEIPRSHASHLQYLFFKLGFTFSTCFWRSDGSVPKHQFKPSKGFPIRLPHHYR